VKVVDELKKVKQGLTVAEIQKRTEIVINDNLLKYIQNNQFIEYNEKTQCYIYKFKYNITCKEELIEILKNGPLLVGDDVENSYDKISEDIQELKENHEVLCTTHSTKKKEVLFLQSHRLPPNLPWEISVEIKDLWNKVSKSYIDAIDLRKYLEKKNLKIAQLDTNVVPEEFNINISSKNDDKKTSPEKKKRSIGEI